MSLASGPQFEQRVGAHLRRTGSRIQAPPDPKRSSGSTENTPQENAPDPPRGAEIPVRRPGFGVAPQKPSWTTLEVISTIDNGPPIEIFNSCYRGGMGPGTTNFILQGMKWTPNEAATVVRTYGDWYLADTGETPDVLSVTGVLLESESYPWFREWMANWNLYLRARRCILNRTEIHLTISEVTYRGYIMACEVGRSHHMQSSWSVLPLQFQMVLRDVDDNTVNGVRVGPGASISPTENPVVSFYAEKFTGAMDFVPAASSSSAAVGAIGADAIALAESAFGLELVHGDSEDALKWKDLPALEDPATHSDIVYTLNINKLTAIANAMNLQAGRQVFDVGKVRRGLISIQNQAMGSRGMNSPYGTPGNQDGYRDSISRKTQNGIDDAVSWGSNKVKNFLF